MVLIFFKIFIHTLKIATTDRQIVKKTYKRGGKMVMIKWIPQSLVFFIICGFLTICKADSFYQENGWYYFERKDYAMSAKYYEEALNENPDDNNSLLLVGWAYFKLERYEEALMAFEMLEKRDKNSFDTLEGIGWSTFKLMDFKKSLEIFESMHKKDKNHTGTIEGLAYNHFKLGNLDEAKKYLNTALKKTPKSVDSNIIMGYVAFAEKDYPLSIQYFKKALDLSEKPDPDTLTAIGNVYLSDKDYNTADLWFYKGLMADSKHPGATAGKINLVYIKSSVMSEISQYFTEGNYDQAVEACNKVEQNYPNWAEVQAAKGWAQFKKENYTEAKAAFEKGLELNRFSYDSYDGLGWSLLKLGERKEATRAFEKSLELYPGYFSSEAGLKELKDSVQ
ncbi:MAG: hypothetical protein A2277_20845 [Desulfobacterales bacterium RIFOXYA12_FULL_46_15]|nr:MAG: hypothetical protein A2277_20845 [Desulfobacterales bacterium RIFOXYA12_FULL_46_15]